MKCPNCGQEVDEGLFCFNCGNSLKDVMGEDDDQPTGNPPSSETLKTSYGQFFMAHVKQPSSAKMLNDEGFVHGIITMGLFALITSLFMFISLNHPMFGNVPFFQFFVMPFLGFFAMQLVVAGATFGGLYISKADASFKTAAAQFGGYVIPFLLIYLFGLLLGMMQLNTLSVIAGLIGTLGALFVIPAFILKEQLPEEPDRSIDFIYLLFGIYALSFLVLGLTMRVYMQLLIPMFMGL